MSDEDDWRLTNQQDYLAGRELRWAVWSPFREGWDHDHCSFCWATISSSAGDDGAHFKAAWVTADDSYYWVCGPCFDDFRDAFAWTVQPAAQ